MRAGVAISPADKSSSPEYSSRWRHRANKVIIPIAGIFPHDLVDCRRQWASGFVGPFQLASQSEKCVGDQRTRPRACRSVARSPGTAGRCEADSLDGSMSCDRFKRTRQAGIPNEPEGTNKPASDGIQTTPARASKRTQRNSSNQPTVTNPAGESKRTQRRRSASVAPLDARPQPRPPVPLTGRIYPQSWTARQLQSADWPSAARVAAGLGAVPCGP
jgi:hypothetical protein